MSYIAEELAAIRRDTGRVDAVKRAVLSTLDSVGEDLLELTGLSAEQRAELASEQAELERIEAAAHAEPAVTPYKRKNLNWAWWKRSR